MVSKNDPKSKEQLVIFKDGNIEITDNEIKDKVFSLIKQTQKYAQRRKKEIERLLDGRVDVRFILNLQPPSNTE